MKTLPSPTEEAYFFIYRTNVINQWRAHQRVPQGPIVVTDDMIPRYNVEYPIIQAHSYHHLRTIVKGDMAIKELCFIARPLGVISSAANKYVELLILIGLPHLKDQIRSILCMAEGSGGTLSVLGGLFPGAKLSYNTWMSEEIDLRDDITNDKPPALVATQMTDRLVKSNLACGETNILKDKFVSKLVLHITATKPDLVTIDAENLNHSTNIHFVEKLKSAILVPCVKIVIVKMFHECDLEKVLDKMALPRWHCQSHSVVICLNR
ncbi:hypothetical protein WDU94_014013 [Cyamophila willieti]